MRQRVSGWSACGEASSELCSGRGLVRPVLVRFCAESVLGSVRQGKYTARVNLKSSLRVGEGPGHRLEVDGGWYLPLPSG